MKSINLFQITFAIVTLLFLTSCTQEADFEQVNETATFKIIPISNSKNATYTENYKVANQTTKIDIANDKISLEIPIPESDFELLRVYNISTDNNAAILYLIGRNNTEEIVKNPIKYLIQDELSISNLGLDTELLQNGNGLRIFVMNNSQEIETDSNIYNCISDKVNSSELNKDNCTVNTKAADGPLFYKDMIIFR